MPSGSKKRKAAKKKKEKEATTNSATHFHGDADLKVIDEKESDGGEVCSPASQGHHNNGHPFAEGEEEMEKRDDTSSVRSIAAENEPVVNSNAAESSWKVTMEENDVIQIDREVKPEDDSDSKNVESVKDSNGGQRSQDGGRSSSSSSSSSSSDDESHIVEKNIVVIESVELETKEDTPNSVAKCAAFDDPVKITDLPEVAQVTNDVLVMDAYDLLVGEPKDEADDPVESNDPSVILAKPAVLPELTQVADVAPVIESHSLVIRKSTEEAAHSVLETIPLVDSENGSIEVVHVKDDAHLENAMFSNVCDLGFKGNGKDEFSGVSPVVMDMGSQPKEDKFSSTAVDNSAVSSVAAVVEAREEKDKLLLSSSVDTTGGAEHIKDNVFIECSDSQPLVASAPRPVQTTSWMSCCGLFEVFTGSNR